MGKMIIEGDEKKIKKLRKELKLKLKRNGLTLKDNESEKEVIKKEVKEPKKKTVKK
jgi:hypothetical protein